MNELQVEFEEGKREAPAFSLVTMEDLNKEETWQSIAYELENTELDPDSISSNQAFIRSWIDQVILVEDQVSHEAAPLLISSGKQAASIDEIQTAPSVERVFFQESRNPFNPELDEELTHEGENQVRPFWKTNIFRIVLGLTVIVIVVLAVIFGRNHKGSGKSSQVGSPQRGFSGFVLRIGVRKSYSCVLSR